ncbi:MAG TPA: glycosyltransferase family 2 protein, partial [Novosphingobium sp.]|nr:glycosyltransferase family 2 protein [Novosphingobium sp.]
DWNLNDLTFFTDKHNKYATREAIERLNAKFGLFARPHEEAPADLPRQAQIKRWVKQTIYNRLPFWLGPLAYVLFRLTVQLGFLDGYQGVIYHVLQGFWYRFLVGAKTVEFERELAGCPDNAARLARLAQLTGLPLAAAGQA